MGKRSGTDKAIHNIINWAERPEWAKEQATVFDSHLATVCKRLGISQEELRQELADQGYGGMLFGIIFEDFLSRRFSPDNRNVIDDYLARRGWRESVPGRRYLQQLRDSVLSLYEVTAVSPGHHCDLHDLVRGGRTIRVHEHAGTQDMVKWDQIAARVLPGTSTGRRIFSGGILPFPRDAAQSLLKVLADSRKRFHKEAPQIVGRENTAEVPASDDLDNLFLRESAPAFTSIWIIHTLERLHAPFPEIVNRDGDTLVFTETRFPFAVEQGEQITQRLDAAPGWARENPDELSWIWLPDADTGNDNPQPGMSTATLEGGQHPVNGMLELKPGVLTLTTNSMERAEQGKTALEGLLHGLVGPALSTLQTPEQLMAEHTVCNQDDTGQAPADAIDPELAAELVHNMLDQHYRQCLDEPVPALGNKTPRQCARSKQGREKVIDWLKQLENNEQRRAANQGQLPYDSGWMWEELGLRR